MSPEELVEQVTGAVWERWLAAEPDLSVVASLGELAGLRGRWADAALGALVRLAARDSGDEELAGIAVVHQLAGGVRRLALSLRDLSEDIDAVVVGTLWGQIRVFPWRRRTSSYAASLLLDTRRAVLTLLVPGWTRGVKEPVVPVDPQTWAVSGTATTWPTVWPIGVPETGGGEPDGELAALLVWAEEHRVVAHEDARLLWELVAAGVEVAALDTPLMRAGSCTYNAVALVAQRHGRCARTVTRRRDAILARLRGCTDDYLSAVA